MNEILQKRIKEVAEQYAYTNWENDDYHEGAEEGMPFDPIGYLEKCFKKAATFALQNQWISVEEGLPKEGELVFMKCKNNDINTFCSGVYEGIKDEWNEDGVGYVDNVTHWMPIPELTENE